MIQKRNVLDLTPDLVPYQLQPGTKSVNVFSLGSARVSASTSNDKIYTLGIEQEVTIAAEGGMVFLGGIGRVVISEHTDLPDPFAIFDTSGDLLLCAQTAGASFPVVEFTADGAGFLAIDYSYIRSYGSYYGTVTLENLTMGTSVTVLIVASGPSPFPSTAVGRAIDNRFSLDVMPGEHRLTFAPGNYAESVSLSVVLTKTQPKILVRPFLSEITAASSMARYRFYTINQARVRGVLTLTDGTVIDTRTLTAVHVYEQAAGMADLHEVTATAHSDGRIDFAPTGQICEIRVYTQAGWASAAVEFMCASDPK